MRYEIRPVAPAEWQRIRALRLAALQDPVSSMAFARTFEEEAALSDTVWQRRASGAGSQQFVAIDRDAVRKPDETDGHQGGAWVGMLTVVVERPDYFSVNAVYLVPETRGTGLAERLFAAAIAWAWDRTDRVYLWVHQDNGRAESFYQRFGFIRTGETMKYPLNPSETEYEMVLFRDR
ncbi:GNAT family N-acetyltransferase [Streptomyces sp. NPDC008079]|uniref:GNAT family N-acetyltransferase n=1 Tax=unclassified Streptomyces TaxID=2593676 RepID=UPI0033A21772